MHVICLVSICYFLHHVFFILIIKIINDNNTHLGSRMMDHLYFHFEHLKSTHINSVMNRTTFNYMT